MADIVQLRLQKLVPELQAMKKTGLLSVDEVKKLVKKRKAFEYRLQRRTKTMEEYLNYIQTEIKLLSVIAMRRQRLGCQLKRKEIDHSIATRINKLFKAATARYPNDEKLWLSQVEFCQRMKWYHTISGLFTRMLQVHNSKPELWVLAAKWEFEENHAPENARNIFLRSLRFHQDSRLLWTEYFRMELMYVDWILKRKQVLDSQGVEDSENDAVLQGKLASVVYRKATQAIPGADFAISLIEVCGEFDFTSNHIDHIYEDILHRHPTAEVTLDAVARRPFFTQHEELKNSGSLEQGKAISKAEEKVCASYEDALKKVKSEKMWSCYIEFAISRWNSTKKVKRKQKLLDKVLKLMERANDDGLLSADLFMQWCKLLEETGDEDSCCSVALEAARKWPKMVSLWVKCLTVHMQARKENVSTILNEALGNLSDQEFLPVWNLGMKWLSLSNTSKLKEYFENGIQNGKISAQVKVTYLEVTALREGVQAARELYKRLKNYLFHRTPGFYRKMVHIEKAQLKPSIEMLRMYYEDALREYGSSDVDLWVEYILLEHEHPDGDVRKTDMYRWRALKALDLENMESFERKYTLLTMGHKEELFR